MAAATTRVLGSKSPDCFQLRDPNSWVCLTELASDVVVEVGDISFHLHKFPLISRSTTLQKLIAESTTSSDDQDGGKPCTVQLDDLPGGAATFRLAAKFCYDIQFELNAANIVPVRCAAQRLGMAGEGNLAAHAEAFFVRDVLGSWDAAVRALQACDDGDDVVRQLAEDLLLAPQCIESLAAKACADPTLFGWPMVENYTARCVDAAAPPVMWNGISTYGKPRSPGAGWWYRQASSLRLPLYKRLISEMRSRGMSPEGIAGSLAHYARRHLSGLNRRDVAGDVGASDTTSSDDVVGEQRVLLEEIVALLPAEKGVATTRFLLGMLRTATVLHASAACRDALERRAGEQLEKAALEDLLIPNTSYSTDTLYDVDCMQRMLEQFLLSNTTAYADPLPEITADEAPPGELMPASTVAKLVDGYLAEVGTDANLKCSQFQQIVALVPDYARSLDDGLYRAIDIFIKAHPWLTESEREQLCRLMNCQKLSLEACTHAAQNERLPLRVVVQVLFFEQLRLRTTVASWFFVGDNNAAVADQGSPRSSRPRKSRTGEVDFGMGSENNDHEEVEVYTPGSSSEPASAMSVHEIRQRVVGLEGECSSMRQEMHRLGKPKGALSRLFRKLGLSGGGRTSSSRQQQPRLPSSGDEKRSRFLDLGC
ncbi:BTB/POZ domain-containing protein At5g03250-like [Triticum dicoccoides]|uniref:BTB/POZ domain-containing protein At5g03250-like n=1 Tax=Triticum dicoccoides TaxID=85692 RepID=UPI00188E23F7|nr:BTB/POZ domain-containing protein At5g03250-like [Triticum dicoccoides]